MKKMLIFWIFYFALSLLLVSCRTPAPVAATSELNPEAVFTAAAQTAEAKRIQQATITPMPPPEELLKTSKAPTPTPTTIPPSATQTVAATVEVVATSSSPEASDKAEFVADITVPDGTIFTPNEVFTKTWRLKNVGNTTWSSDYVLAFVDGALMSGPASVPLPKSVAPDETVEISVRLIAPSDPGSHRGYWNFRNAIGDAFGVGVNADETIWVDITVEGEVVASATVVPVAGGNIVNDVSLGVDEASFTGECPHTFPFTAQFTLDEPASVTYSLEAGTDASFDIKLPPPATSNLEAGTHVVVYELSFSADLAGWARLHITTPEEVFSNQVDFMLVCQ